MELVILLFPIALVIILAFIIFIVVHIYSLKNHILDLEEDVCTANRNIRNILSVLGQIYGRSCAKANECEDFQQYKCPFAEKVLKKNANDKTIDTSECHCIRK